MPASPEPWVVPTPPRHNETARCGKIHRHSTCALVATSYRDGAFVATFPERKPSSKRIKDEGVRVGSELVFREHHYEPSQFRAWPETFRVQFSDLLATRLNMHHRRLPVISLLPRHATRPLISPSPHSRLIA